MARRIRAHRVNNIVFTHYPEGTGLNDLRVYYDEESHDCLVGNGDLTIRVSVEDAFRLMKMVRRD